MAGLNDCKAQFTNHIKNNLWGAKGSVCGTGSELKEVEPILEKLPELFEEYNIKTILDAPCGDFNWMPKLDYNFENYIGIDIVDELIEQNIKKYKTDSRDFISANLIEADLPKTDLIFCKDLFIHLTNEDIIKVLKNFKKSGSKYLLTTNYGNIESNKNIPTASYRKIDLTLAPFNLCEPITSIPEKEKNKYLSLWNLQELEF